MTKLFKGENSSTFCVLPRTLHFTLTIILQKLVISFFSSRRPKKLFFMEIRQIYIPFLLETLVNSGTVHWHGRTKLHCSSHSGSCNPLQKSLEDKDWRTLAPIRRKKKCNEMKNIWNILGEKKVLDEVSALQFNLKRIQSHHSPIEGNL